MRFSIVKTLIPIFICSFFCCKKERTNKNSTSTKYITEYTYKDHGNNITVKVSKSPKRATLFTPHITEMFLALGLEDKIVFGSKEGEVLPEFKEEYEKIPNKQIGHSNRLTKEAFLLLEPDFISTDYALQPEKTGTAKDLIEKGILPYTPSSIGKENATLEDVFFDFLTLGKIFGIEKKAEVLVESMKEKLAKAQKTFKSKPDNQKPKVMIMSSFRNGIWIFSSLATDLINKANGRNVYEEVNNTYELVSFESAAHKNPDVIFIIHIESSTGKNKMEEKMKTFKTHPILKNINAVKNNKLYEISFPEVSPGVRNVDFIVKTNHLIYK